MNHEKHLVSSSTNTIEQDFCTHFCNQPRQFPAKYLYDSKGSELFGQICDTPEYYITRTEEKLLADVADEIIATIKPAHLIEFGSGASRKTKILLDSCARRQHTCTYWPIDVCLEAIESSANQLQAQYPWLEICPIVGDYNADFQPIRFSQGRKLSIFLGSTIGNLDEMEAIGFLAKIRQFLHAEDYLLLGMDRVKDVSIMEAAYNDRAGITAQFNLNLLQVLNRELGANFRDKSFSRSATYNDDKHRIETYLESKVKQSVYVKNLDLQVDLKAGESILTEISRKFTLESIHHLVTGGGYKMTDHFIARNDFFSLLLMQPRAFG